MKIKCTDCGKSFDADKMLQVRNLKWQPYINGQDKYLWLDENCYNRNHADQRIWGFGSQLKG